MSEELKKAANDYCLKYQQEHGFNTDDSVIFDAYIEGYEKAVGKACEWIERFAYNSVITDNIGEREKQAIIISFKQAMEEWQ